MDLIIPDVSYLVERAERIRGILITHGHEDHIGALPFILPQIPTQVFAPRLAHGLISAKLKERRATGSSPPLLSTQEFPTSLDRTLPPGGSGFATASLTPWASH